MKTKVTVADIKHYVKAPRAEPGCNSWVTTISPYCNLPANYGAPGFTRIEN